MRESHGKPGEYVLSVFSDEQRRHFIIQFADVCTDLCCFYTNNLKNEQDTAPPHPRPPSLTESVPFRRHRLHHHPSAHRTSLHHETGHHQEVWSGVAQPCHQGNAHSCMYPNIREWSCPLLMTSSFCVQDKKWILNHEDVALGELLGKVSNLNSSSSNSPSALH